MVKRREHRKKQNQKKDIKKEVGQKKFFVPDGGGKTPAIKGRINTKGRPTDQQQRL